MHLESGVINTNTDGGGAAPPNTTKVAITLDRAVLRQVDRLVAEGRYPSRSRAIQEAVRRQLDIALKTMSSAIGRPIYPSRNAGSRVSRRALPKRLNPRTARKLASPGKFTSHGAV